MAEKNELMTIKAFAEASGRSQQAIYKQIATRLSAYLHEIDGQKFVERRALYEVFHIGEEVEQRNFNTTKPQKASSDKTLELLGKTIQMLEEQLKAKDQQIEELTSANKELAQSINADRHNELAGTLQQLLPEATPEASCEPVEAFHGEEMQEPGQEAPEAQEGAQKAAEDAAHLRYQQELAARDARIRELESRTFGDYLKGLFRKKKE